MYGWKVSRLPFESWWRSTAQKPALSGEVEGALRGRLTAKIIPECGSWIHEHDELIFCFSLINANSPLACKVGKLLFRSTHGSEKGLIPDFGRIKPPDYCRMICKVDLWYRFRVNDVFLSHKLQSSMKKRLEPESPFSFQFFVFF